MKKLLAIIIVLLPVGLHAATISTSFTNDNLQSGLVGHWTFDGKDVTNGRINDISGQGNHGNTANIATSTFYAPGRIGQSVKFDGVNDRIATPAQLATTGGYTFSGWIKGRPTGNQAVFMQDHNGATDLGLLYVPSANAFSYKNEANATDSLGGWNYTLDNNWHHIVISEPYSGADVDNASFYIDGVLVSSLYAGTNFSPDIQNLQLGGRNDGSFIWGGNLDDVRIYNRALSASEAKQLYDTSRYTIQASDTVNPLQVGLTAHWTFDGKDTLNGVAIDKTGRGNTGRFASIATSTFYTVGKIGRGIRFDGVNDSFSVSNSSDIKPAEITMSMWIRPTGSSGNILDRGYGNSGYRIRCQSTSPCQPQLLFNLTFGADAPNLPLNQWTHLLWVGNSSGTRFYTNGVAGTLDTDAYVGTNATNDLTFGNNGGLGLFNGNIDDVRIYSRVLTQAEITQLYNSGRNTIQSSFTIDSLQSGLVGHWTFDGKNMSSGVARDISGQGNHGNASGISTSTFYTVGKIGQGLKFDGVNDHIKIAATPVTAYPFTFAAWGYSPIGGAGGALISTQDGSATIPYYRLLINASGFAVAGARPDAGAESEAIGTTDLRGGWHHIVGVYSSATSRSVYVDGVFVDSDTTNDVFNTVTNVSIGNTDISSDVAHFTGSIDDVRIYNRALSADEIKLLYNMNR